MKGSIESSLIRMSIGTVTLFSVLFVAFLVVQQLLASNLRHDQEWVTPAREAATALEDSLQDLTSRQHRLVSAQASEEVSALLASSSVDDRITEDAHRISRLAQDLNMDRKTSDPLNAEVERLLQLDARFAGFQLARLRAGEALDEAMTAVEARLKLLLQSADGISGKIRFEYGSSLRRIKRRLRTQGWSPAVRQALQRDVLASSSRQHMLISDVLGFARELNRLAGKVALARNMDELRSLHANGLLPLKQRLEVALDELRLELTSQPELRAIADRLWADARRLSRRIVEMEEPQSLVALRQVWLETSRESAQVRAELEVASQGASRSVQAIVEGAARQGRVLSERLAFASALAQWLLGALVLLAVGGGLLGWRSIRANLAALHERNERLLQLKDELQELNGSLEQRVEDRTNELAATNRDMRAVLDSVQEGLAMLNGSAQVMGSPSSQFIRWFGEPEGRSMAQMLEALDPRVGGMFRLGWSELQEGIMPLEVNLAQLPNQVCKDGRILQLSVLPVRTNGDVPEQCLLITTDVTEKLERERAEQAEREFVSVFRSILRDRASFLDFFRECESLAERIGSTGDGSLEYAEHFRWIHTLKGNSGLFGLDRVASVCHRVESEMVETGAGPTEAQRNEIHKIWEETAIPIRELLADTENDQLVLSPLELDELMELARRGAPSSQLLEALRTLRHEPVQGRLTKLAEQAKALSKRLGKPELKVVVEGGEVRLPREPLASFWSALTHVVRNAVDHGIESPAERTVAGKAPEGSFRLRAAHAEDEVVVEVEDDGRGIDWEAIRAKAREVGLEASDERSLCEMLFAEGFSTRSEASDVSGRGVGMSAVRSVIRRMGGRIALHTSPGEGTRFSFHFPVGPLFEAAEGRTGMWQGPTHTIDLTEGAAAATNAPRA